MEHPKPPMTAVTQTLAALGTPVFLRSIGDRNTPAVVIARWRHGSTDVDVSPSDVVTVVMSLQGGQQVQRQLTSSSCRASIQVGSLSVFSAQDRTKLTIAGEADVLQFFIPEAIIQAQASGYCGCRSQFDTHDSELQTAVMQLFVGATRGNPDDGLLFELGIVRISKFVARYRRRDPDSPAHGGLARAARRRVNDLIFAALEDPTVGSPTLRHMANAANLSVNHFIRAFHEQTGVTPHRYVVRRRLERGIGLLQSRGRSVSEVADRVGFATPAHFVATFRRTMGVTPGAFRNAILR